MSELVLKNLVIRDLQKKEYHLLREFIYHAIFRKDPSLEIPQSIIEEAEIKNYISDFGRKHDFGKVVEVDGKIVAVAWTRLLNGEIKGYGYIDEETPEFAIAVLPEYQGKGIGTKLLRNLLQYLKALGYKQAALAVQKENPALYLYLKVGFYIARIKEEEYVLIHDLFVIK